MKRDPTTIALIVDDVIDLFAVLGFISMIALWAVLASGQVPA